MYLKVQLLTVIIHLIGFLTGSYDPYSFLMGKTLTRQEANQLKFHGVEVFGIGVGHRVDHVEMVGISSSSKNYFRVGDIDDLESSRLFKILLNNVCASE